MWLNKKGLSDIITTVLLVALTLAVIGVVSIFLFTFLNDNRISLSDMNLNLKKIEASYNNEIVPSKILDVNEKKETVYVSVERSSDEANLTGLIFVFSVNGNSYSCTRRTVPNLMETSVYAFKSSIFSVKPEKIEVIPLVTVGKKEKSAKSGFVITSVSNSSQEVSERYDECGGFCCGANPDLPPYPEELV